MKNHLARLSLAVSVVLASTSIASAVELLAVEFGGYFSASGGSITNQPNWLSYQDIYETQGSKTFGAYTVTITCGRPIGCNDTEGAKIPGGSVSLGGMYRDYVSAADSNGMIIEVSGLAANTQYQVEAWSWQHRYTGASYTSNWQQLNDSNGLIQDLGNWNPTGSIPTSDTDYKHTFTLTSTPTGKLRLKGFDTDTSTSRRATLNGLRISTIAPPPTITTVSPNTGSTAGGTSVTITGTNYQTAGTTTVTFGGVAATSVVVSSATSITCVTPGHAVGAVDVVVTNPDAQAVTKTSGFTYAAGGTTLFGVDLGPGSSPTGFSGWTFPEVYGQPQTEITKTIGAYTALCGITGDHSMYANQATGTTPSVPTLGQLYNDGLTPSLWGGGSHEFWIGAAGLNNGVQYDVSIWFWSASTSTVYFSDNTSGSYVAPTVTYPASLPNGGVSAANPPGWSGGTVWVKCDSTSTAPTTDTGYMVTIRVTANASGRAIIRVWGGETSTYAFRINGFKFATVSTGNPAPTITSISPNNGPTGGGTAVTITGTNFQAGATVAFNGVAATGVSVVNATTITCNTPAGSTGLVPVRVTNTDTQYDEQSLYTYNASGGTTLLSVEFGGTFNATGGTVTNQAGWSSFQDVYDFSGSTAKTFSPYTVTVTSGRLCGFNDSEGAKIPGGGVTLGGMYRDYVSAADTGGVTVEVSGLAPNTDYLVEVWSWHHRYAGVSYTSNWQQVDDAGALVLSLGAWNPTGAVPTSDTAYKHVFTLTSTSTGKLRLKGLDTDTSTDRRAVLNGLRISTNGLTPAPTVTSVSPNNGPVAGGTNVTITGTNFQSGPTVMFDGSAATGVTFVNSTTITCTTPNHVAGTVNVTVTNPDTQSGVLANGFTYNDVSQLLQVQFGGDDMTPGNVPAWGINYAPVPMPQDFWMPFTDVNSEDTHMAHQFGQYNVALDTDRTLGGTGAELTQWIDPAVVSLKYVYCQYATGYGDNSMIVTVSGLAANTSYVVEVWSWNFMWDWKSNSNYTTVWQQLNDNLSVNKTIGTWTPSGPAPLGNADYVHAFRATSTSTGKLILKGINNGSYTNRKLAVINGLRISSTDTTYPLIGDITPCNGKVAGGTPITINGDNFTTNPTVTIGGVSCTSINRVSATQITCVTPAGTAGNQTVVVTNTGGKSDTRVGGFRYNAAPTISSLSVTSGPDGGGTPIIIWGANILDGSTVTIGGVACAAVDWRRADKIKCVTPAGTVGARAVVITQPDGQTVTYNSYTYNSDPMISSVTPTNGSVAGGTTITITGKGFKPGSTNPTVKIGNKTATITGTPSDTSITCTTPSFPAGADMPANAGAKHVVVTNSNGKTATKKFGYTFTDEPGGIGTLTARGISATPTLPSAGGKFLDPDYGTTIMRLTDSNTAPVRCMTTYAYWGSFNCNNTKIWFGADSGNQNTYGMYCDFNPSTFTLGANHGLYQSSPPSGTPDWEAVCWSHSNPDELYTTAGGTHIWKYNVATNTWTEVGNLTAALASVTPPVNGIVSVRQMNISADDKVFSMNGTGAGGDFCFICYDTKTGKATIPPLAGGHDECRIDKSGRYFSTKQDPCYIVDLVNQTTVTMPGMGTNTGRYYNPRFAPGDHAEQGTGFMLYDSVMGCRRMDFGDPLDTTHTFAGGEKCLIASDEDWCLGSDPNEFEYTLVPSTIQQASTYGSNDITVPAVTRDLAHSRSVTAGSYYAMPHATMSQDGRYCAFSSNWGNGYGRTDVFVIKVPLATGE